MFFFNLISEEPFLQDKRNVCLLAEMTFIKKKMKKIWLESKLAISLHPLSERNGALRRSLKRFHTDK